jgi:hypothetical protein
MASWGFGLVNFVFAWPAVYTIDTFGRRTVSGIGLYLPSLMSLAATVYFSQHVLDAPGRGLRVLDPGVISCAPRNHCAVRLPIRCFLQPGRGARAVHVFGGSL